MVSIRKSHLDFIKGIAILLVVLGHSIQYGNGSIYLGSGLFWENPIFILIYSFHMPLFMLISGYFFGASVEKYNTIVLLKKKIFNTFVPVISYSFILYIMILPKIMEKLNVFGIISEPFSYMLPGAHLWFLWSILFNSIIVVVFQKIHFSYIIFIIIGIGLLFIPEPWPKTYSYMFSFYIMGFFTYKYKIYRRIISNLKLSAMISLTFFLIGLSFNEIGLCDIYFDIYRILIGLMGSIFVISVAILIFPIITNCIVTNAMVYIGKQTLGIYYFQSLMFDFSLLLRLPLDEFSIISTTMVFIEVTIVSLLLLYLCKRHYMINKILFGNF